MKRTLIIVRHAKSSWANPLQSDFDRPLNERGAKDAPAMGARLVKAGLIPELIISSTAKRTRETASYIAQQSGYDVALVQWEDKLYHCIPSVIEETLYVVKNSIKTVLIVAHNPGITEFVNQLSPHFFTNNMPTCGIVAATFESDRWEDFPVSKRKVIIFDYPKNEHDS